MAVSGRMRPGEVRERLLFEGRCFASGARLRSMLGVTAEALPSSLRRAVARGDFARVCRGGWVVRDDDCKALGRPLPDLALYVDDIDTRGQFIKFRLAVLSQLSTAVVI